MNLTAKIFDYMKQKYGYKSRIWITIPHSLKPNIFLPVFNCLKALQLASTASLSRSMSLIIHRLPRNHTSLKKLKAFTLDLEPQKAPAKRNPGKNVLASRCGLQRPR